MAIPRYGLPTQQSGGLSTGTVQPMENVNATVMKAAAPIVQGLMQKWIDKGAESEELEAKDQATQRSAVMTGQMGEFSQTKGYNAFGKKPDVAPAPPVPELAPSLNKQDFLFEQPIRSSPDVQLLGSTPTAPSPAANTPAIPPEIEIRDLTDEAFLRKGTPASKHFATMDEYDKTIATKFSSERARQLYLEAAKRQNSEFTRGAIMHMTEQKAAYDKAVFETSVATASNALVAGIKDPTTTSLRLAESDVAVAALNSGAPEAAVKQKQAEVRSAMVLRSIKVAAGKGEFLVGKIDHAMSQLTNPEDRATAETILGNQEITVKADFIAKLPAKDQAAEYLKITDLKMRSAVRSEVETQNEKARAVVAGTDNKVEDSITARIMARDLGVYDIYRVATGEGMSEANARKLQDFFIARADAANEKYRSREARQTPAERKDAIDAEVEITRDFYRYVAMTDEQILSLKDDPRITVEAYERIRKNHAKLNSDPALKKEMALSTQEATAHLAGRGWITDKTKGPEASRMVDRLQSWYLNALMDEKQKVPPVVLDRKAREAILEQGMAKVVVEDRTWRSDVTSPRFMMTPEQDLSVRSGAVPEYYKKAYLADPKLIDKSPAAIAEAWAKVPTAFDARRPQPTAAAAAPAATRPDPVFVKTKLPAPADGRGYTAEEQKRNLALMAEANAPKKPKAFVFTPPFSAAVLKRQLTEAEMAKNREAYRAAKAAHVE